MVQLIQDPKTNWFTKVVDRDGKVIGDLTNVHSTVNCETADGCAIHNRPSEHPLKDAPMNWRSDRNILERVCEHGVGHPDHDSAKFLTSIGRDYENLHGCDGCC